MTDTRLIAIWLNDLAVATAGTAPLADSRAKVATLTAMLADEFPPQAFTRASLQHVARNVTFFPAYAELVKALGGWWKNNKPPAQAVTYDQFATSDWARHQRDESWRTMTPDALRAKIRDLDGHPMRVPVGSAMAAAISRSAPHLVAFLPPEFLTPQRRPAEVIPIADEFTRRFEATHGRKPGQLTAEQLATLRGKAPAA